MYRHIIWDFDGTLYDTYPVMARAFAQALAEFGHSEPECEVFARLKRSRPHTAEHYREKYGVGGGFFELEHKRRLEAEWADCAPFPGIPALLREVCEGGGRNYLYTHRGGSALRYLERDGLRGLFTGFVTGEDGFPRKPCPDAILHLLRTHEIPPKKALMIGDRELDVMAAKNAGIAACLFALLGEECAAADSIADGVEGLRELVL